MSYRAEILPDIYAQGSAFGLGFDTRIVELRNGWEQRLQRHDGRHRYEVNLNIFGTDKLYTLYEFYQAVGRGALNSFKFKDWFDYATTADGVTHNGQVIDFNDQATQSAGGRTVRLVKRYTFGNETYVRWIRKPKANTVRMALAGAEIPSNEWVLDEETGLVTFGGVNPVGQPTWGGEFFTEVRFEEDVDALFQIALLGKNTGELPSIGLVENLTEYGWSQDWPAGGAHAEALPANGTKLLNQFLGRAWGLTTVDNSSGVVLPDILEGKTGGPHFLVFNGNPGGGNNLNLYDSDGVTVLAVIAPKGAREVWLLVSTLGDKVWVVV